MFYHSATLGFVSSDYCCPLCLVDSSTDRPTYFTAVIHFPNAQVGKRCGNVEEQVDCLIDHATDPNILGRTYVGWEPWV